MGRARISWAFASPFGGRLAVRRRRGCRSRLSGIRAATAVLVRLAGRWRALFGERGGFGIRGARRRITPLQFNVRYISMPCFR
uniref:Uncharacterized protein n=1 Tax=Oryza glumipatula TaxID=40148 RepID=A0A0E0BN98_9ORYZ